MKCNEEIYSGESDEGQLGHRKLNQYIKITIKGLSFKNALKNILVPNPVKIIFLRYSYCPIPMSLLISNPIYDIWCKFHFIFHTANAKYFLQYCKHSDLGCSFIYILH